jgi:predicted RNA binding protein YcfA (HicA-like mRNA interferase family)
VPDLPVISGDEFAKAVRKIGYVWDHTEGSHMILLNASGRRLSVPRHAELGRGVLKDAGLSRQEFLGLLQD